MQNFAPLFHPMKCTLAKLCRMIPILALVLSATSASAQGTKADNGTALNLTGSWVGSTLPTASTLMIVDGAMGASKTVLLGDNLSVLGIAASSGNTLTISNTAGKTLTIGSSGISSTGAGALNFGNVTSIVGGINSSGTGALNFSNTTSLGGNITLGAGATGIVTFSALTLTSNQTWALGGTSNNNRINVSGPLTTGGNTLSISAANANFGIINFNSANTLGTEITIGTIGNVYVQPSAGAVTINGTNNTNTNFSLFTGTANIASMGNLTGTSSIGKNSAYVRGSTTLNYTGNTFSSNKGFTRDNVSVNTNSTINVTTAGETLSMSGALTSTGGGAGGWVFGGAGNLTLTGVINNSGVGTQTVTKEGTGTLTLDNGSNNYAGGTKVNQGTLTVVAGGSLGATTGSLTVNNTNTGAGTNTILNLSTSADTTVGTLSGTLSTPSSGTNTATINTQTGRNFTVNQTAAGTYAGVIAGPGSVTLGSLSTNTLTLTGNNTYSGTTTLMGGSLQVGSGGVGTTGTGAITAQSGSTLLGSGTVQGTTFTADSGSTIRPGDSSADSSMSTLTFTPTSASGSTTNLQGSIVLGISTPTSTDATFGGNAVGSAGYNAWVDAISGTGGHDRLVFNNPTSGSGYNVNFLTTTGSLQVIGSSFAPAGGQVFNLLDWSNLVTPNFTGFTYTGGFLTGNGDEGADLDLPDLNSLVTGLYWDFSRFTTSGVVVIVPEPSRALLIMVGLAGFVTRRNRKLSPQNES